MTRSRPDGNETRAPASPPCYQGAFDGPSPTLERAAVVDFLNELLEGERAGAQALAGLAKTLDDETLLAVVRDVARDEGRYCAMLARHVERFGGQPTRATGVFLAKFQSRDTLAAKLRLLDRGQAAVVRRLDETIGSIADPQLVADLAEMRDTHVANIERCAQFTPQSGT